MLKALLLILFNLLIISTSFAQSSDVKCGHTRWSIKTFTDGDRRKVNLKPLMTTITDLNKLAVPSFPLPRNHRLNQGELQVYRVRAIFGLSLENKKDSDIHLFLSDPANPNTSMIAEIPAPDCAKGSGYEAEFRRLREMVKQLPLNSLIEVEGIGFFDHEHDLRLIKGINIGAKNNFELHPVLNIRQLNK